MISIGQFSEFVSRLNDKAEKRLKRKGDLIKTKSSNDYQLNATIAEPLKIISNQVHKKNLFDLISIKAEFEKRQTFFKKYLKSQKDLLLKNRKLLFNRKEDNIKIAHRYFDRAKNLGHDRQKFIILTMADDFHNANSICYGGDEEVGGVRGHENHSLGGATERLGDNWFTFEIQINLDPEKNGYISDTHHFILYFYHEYHGSDVSVMPAATVYPYGDYGISLSTAIDPDFVGNIFGTNYGEIKIDIDGWLNIDLEESQGRAFEYNGDSDDWFHMEFYDMLRDSNEREDFLGNELHLNGCMIPVVRDGDLIIAGVNVETTIRVCGNEGASGRFYLYVLVPMVSLVATPL